MLKLVSKSDNTPQSRLGWWLPGCVASQFWVLWLFTHFTDVNVCRELLGVHKSEMDFILSQHTETKTDSRMVRESLDVRMHAHTHYKDYLKMIWKGLMENCHETRWSWSQETSPSKESNSASFTLYAWSNPSSFHLFWCNQVHRLPLQIPSTLSAVSLSTSDWCSTSPTSEHCVFPELA